MSKIEAEHSTPAAPANKNPPGLSEARRERVEGIICEMTHGLALLEALDDEAAIDAGSVRWAAKRLAEQAGAALRVLDPVQPE